VKTAVLLAVAVVSVAATRWGSTREGAPSVAAEYRGGVHLPPGYVYLRLSLEEVGARVVGRMDTPYDPQYADSLRAPRVRNDTLTFVTGADSGRLAFTLRRTVDGWRGIAVDWRGRSGSAAVVRVLTELDERTRLSISGTYDLGAGRTLMLAQASGTGLLWYRELPSLRMGPLWPTTYSTFIIGSAFLVLDSARMHIRLARDETGRVRGLVIKEGGERERLARRLVPYREQPVVIERQGVRLTGTVLMPVGKGPFPGVVLVHGSGPATRDGFQGLIRFMADAYARNGIASLIFDKRGTGNSKGDWQTASFDVLAGDVAAAVAKLREQPGVEPAQVGLSGTSQAGWVMAAATSMITRPAFVVMQSAGGSGLTAEEQEMARVRLEMTADGRPETEIAEAQRFLALRDHYVKTGLGWEVLDSAWQRAKESTWIEYPGGVPPRESAYWGWYRSIIAFDPRPYWEKYEGPVLALFGGLDTPTPVPQALAGFSGARSKGRRSADSIVVVRSATHDFFLGETGGRKEFPILQQLIPGYYDVIVEWVKRHACASFHGPSQSEYVLPFQAGKSFKVLASTGHYRTGNRGVGLFAIDFAMPIGTPIVAAREGVVIAVRDSFPDGNNEDLKENFVFVNHSDGSIGRYMHLTRGGALVRVGQRVRQGEMIARSGNSGQSTQPHLHFDVQRCGPNMPPNYNALPCGETLPVTFRNTVGHPCGLQAGNSYRALQAPRANSTSEVRESKAQLFGRGIFSTGHYELPPTFTRDGTTAYFTMSTPSYGRTHVIMEARLVAGKWTAPRIASFSGRYADADPIFSPDGRRLYFISKRPSEEGAAPRRDFDVWVMDTKDDGSFLTPTHVAAASGPDAEHYVTAAQDGTLYIAAVRPDSRGRGDIYRVPREGNGYGQPENLGPEINSPEHHDTTPWIAPDQSYLIFSSFGRADGNGPGGDLYISFRRADGTWSSARSLGPAVNSASTEYCPVVSPDGRYLYFASERSFADAPSNRRLSTAQWFALLTAPGNGLGDTYRIALTQVVSPAR
jgi:hypothetical protein